MEIDPLSPGKGHKTHKVTKLLPDATIFRSVNDKKIDEYVNVITSETPTGGNLKYSFERFNTSEFLEKFRNMRDLKDEATKLYVNTFLADINDLKRFVMFMYQILYFEILVNINAELTKTYNKNIDGSDYTLTSLPLEKDEKIILYFKGGTTMFLIYDNFISNIDSAEKKAQINEQLKSKFSPSDTDMGIEIVCNTTKRFIIIKNALSSIITRTFNKIGYMFDFLLNNNIPTAPEITHDAWLGMCKSDPIISKYFSIQQPPNIVYAHVTDTIENIITELQKCKTHVKNYKYADILPIINKYVKKTSSGAVSVPNNPVICALLLEFIKYVELMNVRHNDRGKLIYKILASYILSLEVSSKHILLQLYTTISHMYSAENKDKYLSKLHTVFNSTEFKFAEGNSKNIYHESFNGADKLIRRKQYDIPREAIKFSTRNNFAISSLDDPYYTGVVTSFIPQGSDVSKSHYISVNNSILVDSNNIKIDFSLFRIKLLLEIADENAFEYINKLSYNNSDIHATGRVKRVLIPSEILDVSIAGKTDTGHCIVINEKNHLDEIAFKISDTLSLNLITYSTKNHINDLNQILFKQCMFTPWLDAKYAKRIDRLVFFIMIHMHQKNLTGLKSYTDLLSQLKSIKNQITIKESTELTHTKTAHPTKIYLCNSDVIRKFGYQLLGYVNNKNDYNFLVLTRKIKYIYTNVPYLYFDIFNLSPETDFNYFELLINCCLVWACLLYTDTCIDNYIINSTHPNIEIKHDHKLDLINVMHKKNAMYIISGPNATADVIIANNMQKYLEFLYTVGSKIELLEPLFNNSGAATNGTAQGQSDAMNIAPNPMASNASNAMVPRWNRSVNETLKRKHSANRVSRGHSASNNL
jgi:hypothetical protein